MRFFVTCLLTIFIVSPSFAQLPTLPGAEPPSADAPFEFETDEAAKKNAKALENTIKVKGTLKAATVFNDRATLSLEAKKRVPAGKHVVTFEGLPTFLMKDTLRAKGESRAEAVLGALSHRIVNNVKLSSEREAALTAQKETLEDQKKLIEAELEAVKAKKNFLTSLEAKAIEKTNDEIAEFELNSANWLEAANTL